MTGVGSWDGHKTIVKQYSVHGPILDQPVAGLLRDLKNRGLLADTLVAFVTEFGYKAVKDVATIYDLHATILHLLGLDHSRLSYCNNGVERRLTDVHGHVIEPILG